MLIVDAAIRSGKTLQSLAGILRAGERLPIKEVVAFYALDGLFNEPREELEKSLEVEIRSLFRLPLGAPTEPVGRYCRQWLNETLGELDQVANGEQCDGSTSCAIIASGNSSNPGGRLENVPVRSWRSVSGELWMRASGVHRRGWSNPATRPGPRS